MYDISGLLTNDEDGAKRRFFGLGEMQYFSDLIHGAQTLKDLPAVPAACEGVGERLSVPRGEGYDVINRGNAGVGLEYSLRPRGRQPPFGYTGKVITENFPDRLPCDQ
jgi:hypothetical protein